MHSCRGSPVGHLLEVAEVPYPLTAFRPERKERNHQSGSLPMRHLEAYLPIGKGYD